MLLRQKGKQAITGEVQLFKMKCSEKQIFRHIGKGFDGIGCMRLWKNKDIFFSVIQRQ